VVVLVLGLLSACGGGGEPSSGAPQPTGVQADDIVLRRGRAVFVARTARGAMEAREKAGSARSWRMAEPSIATPASRIRLRWS
jgi:hypothetical protein